MFQAILEGGQNSKGVRIVPMVSSHTLIGAGISDQTLRLTNPLTHLGIQSRVKSLQSSYAGLYPQITGVTLHGAVSPELTSHT